MEKERGINIVLFEQAMDNNGPDGVGWLMKNEQQHKYQCIRKLTRLKFKGTDIVLNEKECSKAVCVMSLRIDITSYEYKHTDCLWANLS